jgi:hypothetical protein
MVDVRGAQKVEYLSLRAEGSETRAYPTAMVETPPRSKLENPTVVPLLYKTAEVSHRVFCRYLKSQ